jgi:S1-C subfamily serine protease
VTSVVVAAMSAALGACGMLLMAQDHPPQHQATASAMEQLHVQAVYDRLAPSVVDVTATLRYDAETAEGTGIVISAAGGLILTNNHVVRGATGVSITLTTSGRQLPARVVGTDSRADVAILQVPGARSLHPGLAQAGMAGPGVLAAGVPVVAIGNQAGVGGTPTIAPGTITATGQTIRANDSSAAFTETLSDMLATSAHIAPGDSGGPLADAEGKVVGLITAAGAGSPGIGYAIPIGNAIAAARQITAARAAPGVTTRPRGFLGVVLAAGAVHGPGAGTASAASAAASAASGPGTASAPAGAHATSATGSSPAAPGCAPTIGAARLPRGDAPTRAGAKLYGVLCGTGAAAAGLRAGDVITAAAGRPVTSPQALTTIIGDCRPGARIPVSWVSPAGRERTSVVTLDAAPAA